MVNAPRNSPHSTGEWPEHWHSAKLLSVSAVTILALWGAYLRLMLNDTSWIDPDEGIYLLISQAPTISDALTEAKQHAHPPLYFLILWALAAFSVDVEFLRSLSVLAGVLSIPASYLLGCSIGNRMTGVGTAAFATFSPALIHLSASLRPYALVFLVLIVAYRWLVTELRRTHSFSSKLAGIACLFIVATWMHFSVLPVVVGCSALVLLNAWLDRSKLRSPTLLLYLSTVGVSCFFLYTLYLEPLPQLKPEFGLAHIYRELYVHDRIEAWLTLPSVCAYLSSLDLAFPLTIMFLFGLLAQLAYRKDKLFCSIALCSALPLFVLAFCRLYPLFGSRHQVTNFPFIIALCADALAVIVSSLFLGRYSKILVIVCILSATLIPESLKATVAKHTRFPEADQLLSKTGALELEHKLNSAGPDVDMVILHSQAAAQLSPFLGRQGDARDYGPSRWNGIMIASVWNWKARYSTEIKGYLENIRDPRSVIIVTGPWNHQLSQMIAEAGVRQLELARFDHLVLNEIATADLVGWLAKIHRD